MDNIDEEIENIKQRNKIIQDEMSYVTSEFESSAVTIIKDLCDEMRNSIKTKILESESFNNHLMDQKNSLNAKFETLKQVQSLFNSFKRKASDSFCNSDIVIHQEEDNSDHVELKTVNPEEFQLVSDNGDSNDLIKKSKFFSTLC